MKKLFLFLILFLSTNLNAQTMRMFTYSSAPSGGCQTGYFAQLTTTGTLYYCKANQWASISSSGSTISGTLTSGRVALSSGTNTVTDDSNFTYNAGTNALVIQGSLSVPLITNTQDLNITPAAGNSVNINLATTGDFKVNTNQLYVDTSSGNVGIGVTTPAVAFDVLTRFKVTSDGVITYGDAGAVYGVLAWDAGVAIIGGQSGKTARIIGDSIAFRTPNNGADSAITAAAGTFSGNVQTTALIITPLTSPANNATCTAGQFYVDTGFIYICTASGTVKRIALSTF